MPINPYVHKISTSIHSRTRDAARFFEAWDGNFAEGSWKAECNFKPMGHVKPCNCKRLPAENASSSSSCYNLFHEQKRFRGCDEIRGRFVEATICKM